MLERGPAREAWSWAVIVIPLKEAGHLPQVKGLV